MTTVLFLSPAGQPVATVKVPPGESVMHAALHSNVDGIEAECGGCLSCATCHVYVKDAGSGPLPPASEEEMALLEFVAAERRPESRLSCQLIGALDVESLTIELPLCQVA